MADLEQREKKRRDQLRGNNQQVIISLEFNIHLEHSKLIWLFYYVKNRINQFRVVQRF